MKLASWNVNSIRARIDHLTHWLVRELPDVVCLQETKVDDSLFPNEALAEAGYASAFFGQKGLNGVAICTRFGIEIGDVKKNLDGDDPDAQRRLISANIEGVRVVNVYVPNGQSVGAPAFAYKLAWLQRLHEQIAQRHAPSDPVLICGDFNVAPEAIDVHDPKAWEGQVLFHPDERARLHGLMSWGLVDIVRTRHPDEPNLFSWWDYRMGAFRRNRGLRIDLILVTPPLVERCKSAWVDTRPRELERPSDHAPVMVEFDPP